MAEKVSLRVELDGAAYNLVSTTSTKRLQETADLVAEKIKDVRAENPHYSSTRCAMLVALQLSEELLKLQDEYLEVLQEAEIGAQLAPPRLEVVAAKQESVKKQGSKS